MSWTTEAAKNNSEKITLVEISVGSEYTRWFNYDNGVWFAKLKYYEESVAYSFETGGFSYCPFEQGGTADLGTDEADKDVSAVFVDGEEQTERASIALVKSNARSWYWDSDNQLLYIHLVNHQEPQLHSVTVGYPVFAADHAVNLNSRHYPARLNSGPTISKTKDPLYYGKISFDSGSIEIENSDGHFDGIMDEKIFGQICYLKHGFGGMPNSEYRTIWKGYIEQAVMNYNTLTFDLVDNRKVLSRRVPLNAFDQTTYANLKDDYVGRVIPIFYGEIKNAEVLCVNSEEAGTPAWTFKVCDVANHSDGIQAIDTVYVDGSEVTPSSTSLTAGTFTLANGDWDGTTTVTFDGKGLKNSAGTYIENPLDIIKDMLDVFSDVDYDSTNYDTDEWATSAADALCNDVGVWIDESTEIIDIIEELSTSVFGNFIVLDDGRFTFRIFDSTATPVAGVFKKEFLGAPEVLWDGAQFLTSCRVGYLKDWEADEFAWVVEDDDEADLYDDYKKHQREEFETLLGNATDAGELATAIMAYYDAVEPVYTITTKTQHFNREIGDIIAVQMDRISGTWRGWRKCEVVGVSKDIVGQQVTIQARDIGSYSGFIEAGPYAINVDEYAINIDQYALAYGRRSV